MSKFNQAIAVVSRWVGEQAVVEKEQGDIYVTFIHVGVQVNATRGKLESKDTPMGRDIRDILYLGCH